MADGTNTRRGNRSRAVLAINDAASFQALATTGSEIAGLYALARLDTLVDLAHLVATDFFARPEMYRELAGDGMAEKIAQLHARYGHEERFLNHEQRAAVFRPLFDDTTGDFVKYRDALLSAAATFAEWGQATGIAMLREAVRTAHLPFKEHLTRFSGASLTWSARTVLPHLTEAVCYPILRDRGVTSVFGIARPPSEAWPFREDANGDQLVEEICRRLSPDRVSPLTRHAFSLQQRSALRGAEAIAAVLAYSPGDSDEQLEVLITRCYTWHAALHGVTGLVNAAPAGSFDGNGRTVSLRELVSP
jgi:hypothetical protein